MSIYTIAIIIAGVVKYFLTATLVGILVLFFASCIGNSFFENRITVLTIQRIINAKMGIKINNSASG